MLVIAGMCAKKALSRRVAPCNCCGFQLNSEVVELQTLRTRQRLLRWISATADLYQDAIRDLQDLKTGIPAPCQIWEVAKLHCLIARRLLLEWRYVTWQGSSRVESWTRRTAQIQSWQSWERPRSDMRLVASERSCSRPCARMASYS